MTAFGRFIQSSFSGCLDGALRLGHVSGRRRPPLFVRKENRVVFGSKAPGLSPVCPRPGWQALSGYGPEFQVNRECTPYGDNLAPKFELLFRTHAAGCHESSGFQAGENRWALLGQEELLILCKTGPLRL